MSLRSQGTISLSDIRAENNFISIQGAEYFDTCCTSHAGPNSVPLVATVKSGSLFVGKSPFLSPYVVFDSVQIFPPSQFDNFVGSLCFHCPTVEDFGAVGKRQEFWVLQGRTHLRHQAAVVVYNVWYIKTGRVMKKKSKVSEKENEREGRSPLAVKLYEIPVNIWVGVLHPADYYFFKADYQT